MNDSLSNDMALTAPSGEVSDETLVEVFHREYLKTMAEVADPDIADIEAIRAVRAALTPAPVVPEGWRISFLEYGRYVGHENVYAARIERIDDDDTYYGAFALDPWEALAAAIREAQS